MKQAVFFLTVWPEPRSSAAGVRTRELMAILQAEGFEVHAVSPGGNGPYRDELENLQIRTHSCDPNESSATDPELALLSPQLVIFDRFLMEEQFGWRTRQLWPIARAMVDTIDLHALRRARERTGTEIPSDEEFGDDLLRELASLHRAGGALVVSPVELELLVKRFAFPPERVACVPFSAAIEGERPGFFERANFCFLGNFRHAPNLDSVNWILHEHWPKIRARLPNAELHLYGAYPPAQVSAHKGKSGVFSHGYVQDHRAALKSYRCLLGPLRFGAGIKGKVMEAWACGTPVAGTTLTFEGMGNAGLRSDSLAEEACDLHESQAAWEAESARGIAEVEALFSPASVRRAFLAFLAESPATAGLTGRMLRHQSNNATKYFSRWIEAKNQKP
jgi:glycosyltransferase involved in cell wall biosynthesis